MKDSNGLNPTVVAANLDRPFVQESMDGRPLLLRSREGFENVDASVIMCWEGFPIAGPKAG